MITLRGRIFFIIFFALLGLASLWLGAWAMHAVGPDSWMEFPIYLTALWTIVASAAGIVWVVSL